MVSNDLIAFATEAIQHAIVSGRPDLIGWDSCILFSRFVQEFCSERGVGSELVCVLCVATDTRLNRTAVLGTEKGERKHVVVVTEHDLLIDPSFTQVCYVADLPHQCPFAGQLPKGTFETRTDFQFGADLDQDLSVYYDGSFEDRDFLVDAPDAMTSLRTVRMILTEMEKNPDGVSLLNLLKQPRHRAADAASGQQESDA